jgi:hypothetical protein
MCAECYRELAGKANKLAETCDRQEKALRDIERWARAYPLKVFPEPDLRKAAWILKQGGMTLDAISAHCYRHVLDGVTSIARDGLGEKNAQET